MDVFAFVQIGGKVADNQRGWKAIAKDWILLALGVIAEANARVVQRQKQIDLVVVLDAKTTADIGVVDRNFCDPPSDPFDRQNVAEMLRWLFEERDNVQLG